MDTSAKALVEHWSWAAEKGLMNGATARAYRAACSQILSVLGENWESIETTTIDPDEAIRRFKNLRARDFKPASIATYEGRFKSAIVSFLAYVNDPGAWKPASQDRAVKPKDEKRPKTKNADESRSSPSTHAESSSTAGTSPHQAPQISSPPFHPGPSTQSLPREEYGDFTFPIRRNFTARIVIPRDLTQGEAKRLSAFISLLVQGDEAQTKNEPSS